MNQRASKLLAVRDWNAKLSGIGFPLNVIIQILLDTRAIADKLRLL